MAENRPDNIIKNPRRVPVTFAAVVFVMLLVYFAIQGILVLNRTRIQAYNIGAPQSDNIAGNFTGMILREEKVVTADRDGYVNYYSVQGERLSRYSLVCTITSGNDMEERLHKLYYGQGVLTQESRLKIQEIIEAARTGYDPMEFSTATVAKANIKSTVFNRLLKDGGEDFLSGISEDSYSALYSSESGFMILSADGYENAEVTQLKSADFDVMNFKMSERTNGEYVKTGDFVYKIAADDTFRLVFPLSAEQKSAFAGKKNLTVRMPDGNEIVGAYTVETLGDGRDAGVITFRKYGSNYAADRLVNFQILDKNVNGYKIPESAIVNKSFFVVDEMYIAEGGARNQKGVLVKKPDGTVQFTTCTIYTRSNVENADFIIGEHVVYLYSENLKAGDVLIADTRNENSGETEHASMTLGVMASVEGVYQINNGYCVFKPIVRIANSLDTSYVIISSRVRAGLTAYDRIVMDASIVTENQIIFE